MTFADAEWWEMVAGTVAALHVELGVAPTAVTVGAMLYRAREQGQDGEQLRAWLAAQPRPEIPPVVVPPVQPPPPAPPAPVPVPVPAPPSADAIPIADLVITSGSSDVRDWPIGTTITEFEIRADGTIAINFDTRNGPKAWPIVMGREGQIQYTLWVACRIGGRWYTSGVLMGISRAVGDNYLNTGPTLDVGQLPNNWYYFAGDPLASYQPAPGERVAFFVTAGAQRRDDVHIIAERSNVIVVPFQAGKYV